MNFERRRSNVDCLSDKKPLHRGKFFCLDIFILLCYTFYDILCKLSVLSDPSRRRICVDTPQEERQIVNMIKGKLKKSAAGILAAALIITTCTAASLYADSRYKEENKTDIMSEEDDFGTDPEESDASEPVTEDTQTEESSEEETQTEESSEEETQTQYTETEPVTEETPETPSESEPPIPEETTAASTTNSTGDFYVPTEPPSTAAPIIIILVEPGYVPPETTTTAPVPSEPVSFETTAPIPAQTDPPYIPPTVNKYIRASENVPAVKILTDGEELLDAVADPFEKARLSDGSEVDIILSVNNGNGIKDSDKELIKAAAANAEPDKYSVGEYLDISLLRNIKGEEIGISEAYKEITLTVEIPQDIKDPSFSRTYGLIRLHNGTAALLKDLDSDPDTITVKTDLFSVYAIVYTKNIDDVNIKTSNTLDCLNIFLSVTSMSVILCSFVTLYALWRRKNSKSSKSK